MKRTDMERMSLFIGKDQRRRLLEMAAVTGLNMSELIRRYLDEGLRRDEKQHKPEEE